MITSPKLTNKPPPILLAHSWDNATDLTDWWISEKLDGVRAWWDGNRFISRQGNVYHAPNWFMDGLPNAILDGELWMARKSFQKTVGIVRRANEDIGWRAITFRVFDAPDSSNPFEDRYGHLVEMMRDGEPKHATIVEQRRFRSIDEVRAELSRISDMGGEGLMARQPGSKYHAGRSSTLLKIKTFRDDEGVVVSYLPGKGKNSNRMGSVLLQLASGVTVSVGTGFTDAQRCNPPIIGSIITFRYQELTDGGIPRFPSFIRISEVQPCHP